MHPYHLYGSVPPLEAHKKAAVINTESLKHNYKLLTSKKPDCLPICVVKADAYSHSAEICVPVLIDAGCRFFAVSCIEEAIAVREICKRVGSDSEILILGYTEPSQTALLAENNIIQTAVSLDHAQRLSASAVADGHKIRVHLAIDTGMNRIGICANSDIACDNASIEVEKAFSLPGSRSRECLLILLQATINCPMRPCRTVLLTVRHRGFSASRANLNKRASAFSATHATVRQQSIFPNTPSMP